MDTILTPRQVADKLQIPVKTVSNYLRDGRLKGVRIGKHWRVQQTELERFLESARAK